MVTLFNLLWYTYALSCADVFLCVPILIHEFFSSWTYIFWKQFSMMGNHKLRKVFVFIRQFVLFMYLSCSTTTSFPAICGANHPTFVFLFKKWSYRCSCCCCSSASAIDKRNSQSWWPIYIYEAETSPLPIAAKSTKLLLCNACYSNFNPLLMQYLAWNEIFVGSWCRLLKRLKSTILQFPELLWYSSIVHLGWKLETLLIFS